MISLREFLRQVARPAALAALALPLIAATPQFGPPPERVTFASADRATMLVGYVFKPAVAPGRRVPAVVMMHGRSGAYSTIANGTYDATTLSQRHQFWGHLWASQGFLAILVDGFGPRGYPAGFGRFSYDARPLEARRGHQTPARRLRGARLSALTPRRDRRSFALQGWSNGGSATLASLAPDAPGLTAPTPTAGFRARSHSIRSAGSRITLRRPDTPATRRCGCSSAPPTRRSRRGSATRWSRAPVATCRSSSTTARPTISTIRRPAEQSGERGGGRDGTAGRDPISSPSVLKQ